MSVIMEFAIFPVDKEEHVSQYVRKVVEMIDGLPYKSQLKPMGTIVECNTMEECLAVISRANTILEQDAGRIYCTATFDNKPGKQDQMEHKMKAVRDE